MSKRKSPEASGKKAGAVKQVPKEFRLSNEQTTKAADLAKAINANFNNGDDEQAKAAMRLLEVRGMFPEGRPGNALFEVWCAEHISQSYKTVANLLSHARKGDKAAVLKAMADSRDKAKARAQKSRDRQKAAEKLHADTNRKKADCRKALAENNDDPALAKKWLKENPAKSTEDTLIWAYDLLADMVNEGDAEITKFAKDFTKGRLTQDKALALAAAIETAAQGLPTEGGEGDMPGAEPETVTENATKPEPADQSEDSGGNIADLKPETETGDGTAIPHTFKVKPGQSGADAAREKAA